MRQFILAILALSTFALPSLSLASVHLMQIQKVAGGVESDTTAQAIQLRMRALGQGQLQLGRLRVFDANGNNPIVLATPAAAVANSASGATILFATPSFSTHTTPAAVPDFVMAPIPASYLAAGSLVFEHATLGVIYWRVSWGGASYSGATTGAVTNDADGQFAPNFGAALPSAGLTALRFSNGATALSTNNSADYAESGSGVSFRNNAGTDFVVTASATAAPALAFTSIVLHPAHPNPFNPRTELSFEVTRASHVTLKVFALDGRLIDVLFSGVAPAGRQLVLWDGTDRSGRQVSSGAYVVRLNAQGEIATRTITLLK